MSIRFAAPGIAEEWGITRTVLNVVLSMELVAMGLGLLLAAFALSWLKLPEGQPVAD